ncbi:hypothetical protein OB955_04165 [Halobacteria archaeon AArc-m2/3/4]|uniref:Uncharacterized protein n=1 Tax=Natronoglomus mannanivorans TaxID=2979990 RepID=A0AAP2Z0K2_9EURY|nr:hypothetical protein [Halobacteria archaeon AArc-xg1-1]MCU4971932.1 hypothetical protein [Halobacteria archaeon AArc-m2/3/4]
MTPDQTQLARARDELEEAAKTAGDDDDVRDPVHETAAAFAELANGDQQPDHAVMDEHLNALRQAKQHADGETGEHIEEALEYAEEYREELPQG